MLKNASQVADPPKQLGTSLVGVETIAPDDSRVPHGDHVEPICEFEAPLDSRILKDEKRGTPVENIISVSICATDTTKIVKVGSNLSEEQ